MALRLLKGEATVTMLLLLSLLLMRPVLLLLLRPEFGTDIQPISVNSGGDPEGDFDVDGASDCTTPS